MTTEEKRAAIKDYCFKHPTCTGCPLFDLPYFGCYGRHTSDKKVDKHYELIFGKADKPTSSNVEHPSHYNREGAMECIDEMVLIFGKEAVKNFCLCNSWKYRYRASEKNGTEDLQKSDFYIKKYEELSKSE